MADGGRCILVLGLPRSATTWVTNVLAQAHGPAGRCLDVVFEPDNEGLTLPAHILKRGLPRFPCVREGVAVGLPSATGGPAVEAYRCLWEWAARAAPWRVRLGTRLFTWLRLGGPRFERLAAEKEGRLSRGAAIDPRNFRGELRWLCGPLQRESVRAKPLGGRIIKSVHACLSAPWVAQVAGADAVVVVRRDPRAILASWRRMTLADAERPMALHPAVVRAVMGELPMDHPGGLPGGHPGGHPGPKPWAWGEGDALERMAGQCAVLARALDAAAAKRGWITANHEDLCADPAGGMRRLCERVGLSWSTAAADEVAKSNRPGSGFAAVRDAKREVGKWRREFTDDELARVEAIFAAPRTP